MTKRNVTAGIIRSQLQCDMMFRHIITLHLSLWMVTKKQYHQARVCVCVCVCEYCVNVRYFSRRSRFGKQHKDWIVVSHIHRVEI